MFVSRLLLCIVLFLAQSYSVMAKTGDLNIYLFQDGMPVQGVEMVIDGKRQVITNNEGHYFAELDSGEHFVELQNGKKNESITFYVVNNESTDVILNLFSVGEQDSFTLDKEVSEPKVVADTSLSLGEGVLKGELKSFDDEPISGARVFVQGIERKIMTNEKGEFEAKVPAGRFVVSFVHSAFRTKTVRGVSVNKDEVSFKKVRMEPTGLELDDFVVIAPHVKGSLSALVEVRRNSSKVADVLGSEQMSKAGDSNAASSLARVTGLTIVDGKYVYIRGLGERYSNVLLNNTTLPSPDPTRRVVQLDMFPSGILQSLTVQKSYSPDLPGDFGGGTVVMKTKDIPEEFTAKVSIGARYETGNDRIQTHQGGSRDWLGIDDGTRALPDSIRDATSGGQRLNAATDLAAGFSQQELRQFSKDMPRFYNTTEQQNEIPPSLSLSIGDLFKYKGKKFGYLLSGMYNNNWDNDNRVVTSYRPDRTTDRERDVRISEQTVNLSGMLNLGLDLGKIAKVSSSTMVMRKTTNRTIGTVQTSQNDDDANLRSTELEWQERQLFSQLLKGEHQIGANKKRLVKWRGAYSEALRDQPDARYYEQDFFNGVYTTATDGKRNSKFYNELKDRAQDYAVSIETPVIESANVNFDIKLGGQYTIKERASDTKRFKYSQIDINTASAVTGDQNIQSRSIGDICTNGVIDAGGCLLEDVTDGSDRYEATQEVRAYFIDTETKISDVLRINAGFRSERSEQTITTYEGVDRDLALSGLNMNDILPVVGLTFFTSDTTQFRLAYSETVSRPDFKDLNPGTYFDDERRRLVSGNLNLKGTVIKNIDARFEWYFGKGENFSLGGFRKEFLNPIEEVAGSFNNEGELVYSENNYQLANVGNAESYGLEIEFRKNFAFIHPSLESLTLGGNYSYIASELDIFPNLSGQVTNQNRALQGQSPYIINANISYDNQDTGTIATVLYNIFGRRIDAVGTKPFDDVFEEKFHRLDFVFSQRFGEDNKISFKMQNIIDPEAVRTEAGLVRETFRKGRRASIGYTRTF